MARRCAVAAVAAFCVSVALGAQSPTFYRLTFADRARHVMQVEATFTDVPAGPLQLRMSRSSPGRYSLHEFAKNVFDVRATDSEGRPFDIVHPNPHQWDVSGHAGDVRVSYRVFGDWVDGTYLAIDNTHAHINMPAAIMWARGFDARPVSVRFEPPPGASWRVATQLFPGRDSLTFTAPNLQYLMDSPAEFSAYAVRTFTVSDNDRTPVFRLVAHHTGADADLDAMVRDVDTIVRETRYVFGEFPAFDANTYTFIADFLPGNDRDAMEHRNSTVITSPQPIAADRVGHLRSVSHEFCHAWNVERIRPASLEPFNFDEVNMSGELWLAEGFCNYYDALVLRRSGLMSPTEYARDIGQAIATVMTAPGRKVRSAVEMSQMAPFVDGAKFEDRTSFADTYLSYYTWGEALGAALDLTLRERSDGRITLDDYMRALWNKFGRSASRRPGYVESPYTLADLRATLAEVSGDTAFATQFFTRYVEGHDVVDYARLLARAGLVLRQRAGGKSDSDLELVLSEAAGQTPTEAQRRFRDAWLSSAGRNAF